MSGHVAHHQLTDVCLLSCLSKCLRQSVMHTPHLPPLINVLLHLTDVCVLSYLSNRLRQCVIQRQQCCDL